MRNPIIQLVEKRRRAQYGRFFIESTGVTAAYLVMAGWLSLDVHLVHTVAWTLLLVLPLVACLPTSRFFAGLHQDRVLDDLLITGLTPASIIDGIAWSSLRSVVPFGVVAYTALLLCGDLAHGLSPWLFLWLPGLVLLTLNVSYSTLYMNGMGADKLLHWLAVAGLGLLGLLLSWPLGAVPRALVSVTGLALVAWMARSGSVHELFNPPEGRGGAGMVSRRRFPLRIYHPIVMREWARQAHQVPGGFWALLTTQLLPLPLASLAVTLFLAPATARPVLVILLFVLQPLRSAWRSGVALVTERDARTLDMLHQTPLRAPQFVDGWALTAVAAPMLETLMTWPLLSFALGAASGTAVLLAVWMVIVVSGYLGVMMSSVAPSRTIARRFLHVWMALYIGFGVAPVALATLMGTDLRTGLENQVTLPLMGIGALALFRMWAISRVQDDPAVTGFTR